MHRPITRARNIDSILNDISWYLWDLIVRDTRKFWWCQICVFATRAKKILARTLTIPIREIFHFPHLPKLYSGFNVKWKCAVKCYKLALKIVLRSISLSILHDYIQEQFSQRHHTFVFYNFVIISFYSHTYLQFAQKGGILADYFKSRLLVQVLTINLHPQSYKKHSHLCTLFTLEYCVKIYFDIL